MFSWMVGSSGTGSGTGGGHKPGGGSGVPSDLLDPVSEGSLGFDGIDGLASLSSSEGPSGGGRLSGGGVPGDVAIGSLGTASELLSGSMSGSAASGDSRSMPTRQNLWLGLCRRCWRAAYLEPVGREASKRRKEVEAEGGLGVDGASASASRFD